jgi:ribose 5-phosphate isomerase B
MMIVIGSDHGGKKLKDTIVKHLKDKEVTVEDIGPFDLKSVDYPSYAKEVANRVKTNPESIGILCCGTGIGMSITANKVKGIRAAVVSDVFSAEATKAHNNTNVLCLGERVIGEGLALKIVDTWLQTDFEAGRHDRRLSQITEIEKEIN